MVYNNRLNLHCSTIWAHKLITKSLVYPLINQSANDKERVFKCPPTLSAAPVFKVSPVQQDVFEKLFLLLHPSLVRRSLPKSSLWWVFFFPSFYLPITHFIPLPQITSTLRSVSAQRPIWTSINSNWSRVIGIISPRTRFDRKSLQLDWVQQSHRLPLPKT